MKSASTVCRTAGLKICKQMALDGGTSLADLDAVHRSNKDSAEWTPKNCAINVCFSSAATVDMCITAVVLFKSVEKVAESQSHLAS